MMGKNSKPEPLACKFLYDDDSTPILQIPSRLVKSYGDDLPEMVTLRINHSQKCWKVSVEKFKGQYFFTDGWKEFAQDVDMKTREYLLSMAAHLCEFRVSPYESDDEEDRNSGDYDEDSFTDGEKGPHVGKSFAYTTELKTYHKQSLKFPRNVSIRAGFKRDKRLILQNSEGRQWPVRLSGTRGRYCLTAGWVDFLIANKVIVGSIMSFKFVSGSNKIMEARVIKQGTNKNALFKFVKRKGNKYEVFELDKTSDLVKEAKNLHAAREHGERTQNSHKTSEPSEGPENLYVMNEEGSDNSHKTSEHTEEPENRHKMSEHAEGPENTLKTRERDDRPEIFHKTSDIAKKPENLHATSGFAEGPEKSHGNVKSENEDHFPEEEGDYGVDRISKKLKKHDAYKLDIPHESLLFKATGCSKFQFRPDASNEKELNSGDYTEDGEDVGGDSFTYGEDGPSVGKSLTFATELKSYNKQRLVLPGEFIKRAGLEKDKGLILQDVDGRQWPVRLTNSGSYALTAGWVDFLIANKVTVGSIMSFKFVPGSNKTLEAQVIKLGTNNKALFNFVKRIRSRFEVFEPDETGDVSRGATNSKTTSRVGEGPKISHKTSERDEEKELNSGDHTKNCEDGDSFTDGENGPCVGKSFTFTKELKNYNKEILRLPKFFIKWAGLEEDKGLMLRDDEGRQWPVRITGSCGRYAITAGWVNFLIANNVTVGSIMSFKFVLGSDKIMEARMIKQGPNEKALFSCVQRKRGNWEVFESYKTSDLAREDINLHTTKKRVEGRRYSHKTSEPTEGAKNLHAMKECAEEPDNVHTMSEHAGDPENSHQTSERTVGPENFHKTGDSAKRHGEEPTKLHKTSGHEKSHAKVKLENEDLFSEEDNEIGCERRWRFSKKLKKHNAYKLDIPRDISEVVEKVANGEIKLRDRKWRKWPVRLEYRKCGAYTMTSGWIDFLVGNKVYVGSTISFEFIPSRDSNVMEARVMENGEKGSEFFVKKAKGRPPCRSSTDERKKLAKETNSNTLSKDAGCSRFHFPPDSSNDKELNSGSAETSEDEDSLTDHENDPGFGKSITFTTELKTYHKHRLVLPKKFIHRVKKNKKLVLQDANGKQWPVRLTDRKHGKYALTAGWSGFLVANEVSVGSIMSFKFISVSNNTVEARVIKEGSNKKALFKSVKREGDRFEVFEPGKISSFASGAGNLHATSEPGEGPGNSHNTSEHPEGPEYFRRTSGNTKAPGNLHTSNGREGCEKFHNTGGHVEGPQKSHAGVKSENEDDLLEEKNGFGDGRRWIFSKQLKKHNAYKLDIPRDLSKVIERVTNGKLNLQDCKGRKWPVRLEYRKCSAYTMTSGWFEFLVGNKVHVGSTILFEFIPSKDKNVIEAQVTENGGKGTEMFVSGAKGRPPCK